MEAWRIDIDDRRRRHHRHKGQSAHKGGEAAEYPADQNLHFRMGAARFIFGQNRNKGLRKHGHCTDNDGRSP